VPAFSVLKPTTATNAAIGAASVSGAVLGIFFYHLSLLKECSAAPLATSEPGGTGVEQRENMIVTPFCLIKFVDSNFSC
jgi:hypothetical protein